MSVTNLETIPTLFAQYNVDKEVLDRISVWKGDITKIEVDVIVNAATMSLTGANGVDAAIHRAAGHELREECKKYGKLAFGQAVITKGHNIKHVKNIIHTVGPVVYSSLRPEDEKDLLSCYQKSLDLAEKHNLKTIAFPCIGTGVHNYPRDKAAEGVTQLLLNYLIKNNKIQRVVLVTFLDSDYAAYTKYFEQYAKTLCNQEE